MIVVVVVVAVDDGRGREALSKFYPDIDVHVNRLSERELERQIADRQTEIERIEQTSGLKIAQ